MLNIIEHGRVAEICMNRPPVNAMNLEFLAALESAHGQLCADGAEAIIISGRVGLFSAGLDVPALLEQSREQIVLFWDAFFQLMGTLADSPVPVAAAITGHSPAGGAVLALHCDYRVAASGDFKIGLNEVRVGLPVPASILFMLESVVGARQAALLAASGSLLSPDEALRVGLVDELAAPDDVTGRALLWAESLLALPAQAMNITRRAARAGVIACARANENYSATATDYWFSAETQRMLHAMVAELRQKNS